LHNETKQRCKANEKIVSEQPIAKCAVVHASAGVVDRAACSAVHLACINSLQVAEYLVVCDFLISKQLFAA
jgi:hypothetical protein